MAVCPVNGDERAHSVPFQGETVLVPGSTCGNKQASCRACTSCDRPVNGDEAHKSFLQSVHLLSLRAHKILLHGQTLM